MYPLLDSIFKRPLRRLKKYRDKRKQKKQAKRAKKYDVVRLMTPRTRKKSLSELEDSNYVSHAGNGTHGYSSQPVAIPDSRLSSSSKRHKLNREITKSSDTNLSRPHSYMVYNYLPHSSERFRFSGTHLMGGEEQTHGTAFDSATTLGNHRPGLTGGGFDETPLEQNVIENSDEKMMKDLSNQNEEKRDSAFSSDRGNSQMFPSKLSNGTMIIKESEIGTFPVTTESIYSPDKSFAGSLNFTSPPEQTNEKSPLYDTPDAGKVIMDVSPGLDGPQEETVLQDSNLTTDETEEPSDSYYYPPDGGWNEVWKNAQTIPEQGTSDETEEPSDSYYYPPDGGWSNVWKNEQIIPEQGTSDEKAFDSTLYPNESAAPDIGVAGEWQDRLDEKGNPIGWSKNYFSHEEEKLNGKQSVYAADDYTRTMPESFYDYSKSRTGSLRFDEPAGIESFRSKYEPKSDSEMQENRSVSTAENSLPEASKSYKYHSGTEERGVRERAGTQNIQPSETFGNSGVKTEQLVRETSPYYRHQPHLGHHGRLSPPLDRAYTYEDKERETSSYRQIYPDYGGENNPPITVRTVHPFYSFGESDDVRRYDIKDDQWKSDRAAKKVDEVHSGYRFEPDYRTPSGFKGVRSTNVGYKKDQQPVFNLMSGADKKSKSVTFQSPNTIGDRNLSSAKMDLDNPVPFPISTVQLVYIIAYVYENLLYFAHQSPWSIVSRVADKLSFHATHQTSSELD